MGALISSHKHSEDYFRSKRSISSPDLENPFSKTPRFSSVLQSPKQSKSFVSTINRYPQAPPPLQRELHAPYRILKSKFKSSGLRERFFGSAVMGNFFSQCFGVQSSRYGTLVDTKKDREIIDVGREVVMVEASDDSSVEEIVIIEDDREVQSVESEQRSGEIVSNVQELDLKTAEYGFQPSCSSDVPEVTNGVVNVADMEKMDWLILSHEVAPDYLSAYKTLHEKAHERDPKLESLNSQIEFEKQRLSSLQLSRPVKKPEKDVPLEEAFIPLTEEEEAEVSQAISANWRRVLVQHENSGIEITGKILLCLRPGSWLNDEVINLYLELLKEREKREPKKFLKCHFFNTFFYKKLISGGNGYDFESVKRWTTHRKLGYGLIECDKIIVPIHKEIHWCLAVINKKDEKFQYLDSEGGTDAHVLKVLARYYVDEVKDKSGKDIDVSSWKQEYVDDLPKQRNGFDCGMFVIKYADFYSRGARLCFNQEHMPYFRRRTVMEILRLRAD